MTNIKQDHLNTTGNVSDIQIKVSKAGEALEEQEITEAEIQDGEGHDLESIGNGTEFYVIVPKTSIEEEGITIKATCQVNGTEKRLWVAQNTSQNQEQPLVEITPKSVEKSDEVNITIEKEFDLALRKIITKVNGKDTFYNEQGYEAVRFKNGNINIDTTSIPNTATYMHRKDPVVVNAEDIVTYQIRIYNC